MEIRCELVLEPADKWDIVYPLLSPLKETFMLPAFSVFTQPALVEIEQNVHEKARICYSEEALLGLMPQHKGEQFMGWAN